MGYCVHTACIRLHNQGVVLRENKCVRTVLNWAFIYFLNKKTVEDILNIVLHTGDKYRFTSCY